MMPPKEKLKYLSSNVCNSLKHSVAKNLERYISGTFQDSANDPDWAIQLTTEVDLHPLTGLAATVDDDAQSSLLVWKALGNLPPSLAMEGRIWTRLTHVECLEYARARWIGDRTDEAATKRIEDHFFADTRTACRDDNAIGRLWWTAYVAWLALPNEHEKAIGAIWKAADIRLNTIERPWISSRPRLAGAIVRAILNKPSVSATEGAFRDFMKSLNADGGGLLFEVMTDAEIGAFVDSCASG